MADQLQFPFGVTGRNLYVLWWDSAGRVAVETAFTAVGSTTRTAAAVALTELTGTFAGRYALTIPGFAAGTYTAEIYDRAGGAPATADGPPVGVAEVPWSGAAVVTIQNVVTLSFTAAQVAAAFFDLPDAIEGRYTFRQAMALHAAEAAGNTVYTDLGNGTWGVQVAAAGDPGTVRVAGTVSLSTRNRTVTALTLP